MRSLRVRNYCDPSVTRFKGRDRTGRVVNELILHELILHETLTEAVRPLKANHAPASLAPRSSSELGRFKAQN